VKKDTAPKHVGQEAGEFWVVRNTDHVDGPFPTAEAAKASLEDWELRSSSDIRITRTVCVADVEVIYNTKWNEL
jgi:hypothetical protein